MGLAAAYLALGRQEDALVELDDMPVDDADQTTDPDPLAGPARHGRQCSGAIRCRRLPPVATPASSRAVPKNRRCCSSAPPRKSPTGPRPTRMPRSCWEFLSDWAQVPRRLKSGCRPFESSRLQGHLPQSRLEALIADGSNVDPGAAFGLAVTALTELAADRRAPRYLAGRLRTPRLHSGPGSC